MNHTHTHKRYSRYNFESPHKWTHKKANPKDKPNDNPFGNTPQTRPQRKYDLKPSGLWYSIYNSWSSWGEVSKGKHIHKLTMVPNSHVRWADIQAKRQLKTSTLPYTNHILVLRTLDDVEQFNRIYGCHCSKDKFSFIQWKRVADSFGGIEFRHYNAIKSRIPKNVYLRDYLWYSSLDCSCGCVWNDALVRSIQYVFDT